MHCISKATDGTMRFGFGHLCFLRKPRVCCCTHDLRVDELGFEISEAGIERGELCFERAAQAQTRLKLLRCRMDG